MQTEKHKILQNSIGHYLGSYEKSLEGRDKRIMHKNDSVLRECSSSRRRLLKTCRQLVDPNEGNTVPGLLRTLN